MKCSRTKNSGLSGLAHKSRFCSVWPHPVVLETHPLVEKCDYYNCLLVCKVDRVEYLLTLLVKSLSILIIKHKNRSNVSMPI
jgi:hypothetical protein